MFILLKSLFLAAFLMSMSCCGYHIGHGEGFPRWTFSVPYIEGDLDGSLTSAVIEQISTTTPWGYCADGGGKIQIKIRIIDLSDENIGFRYDRNRHGKLKHYLIPVETRRKITIVFVITECPSGKVLVPQTELSASTDFDHDYYSGEGNVFSLGQLSDIDSARDAALIPLNFKIARTLADYVINLPP